MGLVYFARLVIPVKMRTRQSVKLVLLIPIASAGIHAKPLRIHVGADEAPLEYTMLKRLDHLENQIQILATLTLVKEIKTKN